ncbi:hypothetical protein MPSEU_000413000 [Mayamaea pseudoterrestris]|nr:hypothetical protein MPSEU_000413000 [Mayamaea pseudoterrestris]
MRGTEHAVRTAQNMNDDCSINVSSEQRRRKRRRTFTPLAVYQPLALFLMYCHPSPCSTFIANPMARSIFHPIKAYNMPSVIWESYPPLNISLDSNVVDLNGSKPSNQTDPENDKDEHDRFGIRKVKRSVATFLNEPIVEVIDCFLVLASSLFVAISTVDALPSLVVSVLTIAQDIVAGVFVLEFFARWFCSSAPRGRHLTQPLILVDIFVVLIPFLVTTTGTEWLPAWLTSSSSLINLRLLRVLRLQRVLQNMKTFTRFERALGIPTGNVKAYQLQLARVVLSVFTLVSVATGLIYTVEHAVNPQISDYFTALYFGLTTLTTVGFGDITPVTWQGKLVVSMSIMAGVTVIPAQGAALIDALLERQQEKELREANDDRIANGETNNGKPSLSAISRRRRGFKASSVATSNTSTVANVSGRLTLEMAASCDSCGSTMHWSTAQYCWQCGSTLELRAEERSDVETLQDARAVEATGVSLPE